MGIAYVIGGVAVGIALGVFLYVVAKGLAYVKRLFRHEYPGKKDLEQHRAIYTALVELRALTDADRAYVIRFHNGHEFLLSDPIWKCTCTHEVVRPGVTYESVNIQNLLVSRVAELVEPIIAGEYGPGTEHSPCCTECPFSPDCERIHKNLAVIQADDMPEGFAKFFLKNQNIKTILMCGLTSKHGPFGIVGVDFTGAKREDADQILKLTEMVCKAAGRIQFMFLKKELAKIHPSGEAITVVP
jgi:hypothetical protein